MNPAIIQAILSALLSVLADFPSLVADVEQAWQLLTSSSTPTAEQMAAYAAAVDAAHKALQQS